jgi:hypothetical protein
MISIASVQFFFVLMLRIISFADAKSREELKSEF